MTFNVNGTISEGNVVVLYSSLNVVTWITVIPGKEYKGKWGSFLHSDMIGKKWGTKLGARHGEGHLFLLKPTPELWSRVLPHHTQVIYNADSALIAGYLDIKSGSTILEVGCGSGCLSISLCRTVRSSGKVYTFENNLERYNAINRQIKAHGLEDVLIASHRDVCADGFGLEGVADCVFIDVPTPWDVIPHSPKGLKQDKVTRICVFCPCIEQIIKSCTMLETHGFFDIEVYETRLREFCVKKVHVKNFEFSTEFSRYFVEQDKTVRRSVILQKDNTHKSHHPFVPERTEETLHVTHEPKCVHGYTAYIAFASYHPSLPK